MTKPVWNWDNNNNGRPFLPTNSWRALRQRLLRTPELILVSLAGTRCSKVRYQSSNSVLTQNSSVNSHSYQVVIKTSYCSNPFPQLPYCFSLFPQWISWITFTWMNSLWKFWAAPSSLHWVIFKRLPRSFWVSCHLMSHLLWSHFLEGSWPQI